MSQYEIYMNRAYECWENMKVEEDLHMKRFWYNAMMGFKKKALSLKLSEVQ